MMKKAILILGILALSIFIFLLAFGGLDIYFINLTNNSKLPNEYENYKEIKTNKSIQFGNHELKFLCNTYPDYKYHISSKNNFIVYTQIGFDYNYYKLDVNGNLIDTFKYVGKSEYDKEQIIGENIVNLEKDYYRNWITDGDTLQNSFIKENEKLTWSFNKQLEYFKKIKNETDIYTILLDGTTNINHRSVKYFLNNKWYKLFVDGEFPNSDYKSLNEEKISINDEAKNIVSVYFQKIEIEELTGSVGGGSIQTSSYYWEGNLFCNLLVGGDTLKFKTPAIVSRSLLTSGDTKADLQKIFESELISRLYYKNDNFNFSLFANDQNALYIIKKRQ